MRSAACSFRIPAGAAPRACVPLAEREVPERAEPERDLEPELAPRDFGAARAEERPAVDRRFAVTTVERGYCRGPPGPAHPPGPGSLGRGPPAVSLCWPPMPETEPSSAGPRPGEATPGGRHGMVLALACVAQFMVVLDVSVVNVALPSIGRDLHYTPTGLQWVVNAYVLTFAGFLLLGGRAVDLFCRRKTFIFGLVLFSAASLVGGFAQNAAWLTTARAIQGVGGAVLSPATLTIIVTTFTGRELARAIGLWGAMGGAGGAVGVLLGGVLTSELNWRWVLFINVPIGVVALVATMASLTEARRLEAGRKLDVAGALLVTAGLAVLAYGIVSTDQYPWGSTRTLVTLGIAVALLAVFLFVEVRVATAPLMPLRLFRSRWVSGANIVMLLIGAAFFSMWYFLSLYLQNVLHFSPLRAGLAFAPMAVAIITGAQFSSRIITRTGQRALLLVGTALAAGGFVWLAQLTPDSGYWTDVFGGGVVVAFALGLMFTPLASAATADVAPAEAGLASGLLNTSRQVGGSIGLAALATIATDRTRSLTAAGHDVAQSLTAGYARAFLVAAGLSAVGFVASTLVPRRSAAPSTSGVTATTSPTPAPTLEAPTGTPR